jgi:hypothetical protein
MGDIQRARPRVSPKNPHSICQMKGRRNYGKVSDISEKSSSSGPVAAACFTA